MFEPVSMIAGGIAGGVVGYALKDGSRQPQPVTWDDVIRRIESTKPQLIDVISLDATTARDKVVQEAVGDFILVEHYPSSVPFYIRLNDTNSEQYDLSKLQSISGPFVRFYISNVVGNGEVKLYVCRGVKLTPKLFGIEELANRLIYDVPMSFDGRGEVIWADNFEDNINKWQVTGTGSGYSATLSTDTCRNKAKSVKLVPGNLTGNKVAIARGLPRPIATTIGFEFSFAKAASPNPLEMHIGLFDGTNLHEAAFRYYDPTSTIQYKDSAGSWQDIATDVDLGSSKYLWNGLKLVADFDTNKYVRLIFNNRQFDLSLYALYESADSSQPYLDIGVDYTAASNSALAVYGDGVIATKES